MPSIVAQAHQRHLNSGSVKSLLPRASRLTIPGMETSALTMLVRGDNLLQSAFTYEGEPLLITIVQRGEPALSS